MGSTTPKQVVRNIESALMAQLGIRIDHRKISVATTVKRPMASVEGEQVGAIEPAKAEAPAASVVGRLLYFEDVEVHGSRAKGVTCRVTLRRGKDQFVGESAGAEGEKSRMELAARATIAAIALCDGGELKLSFEGAKVVETFDRELVLVAVLVRQGRSDVHLTGSCEVKENLGDRERAGGAERDEQVHGRNALRIFLWLAVEPQLEETIKPPTPAERS